MPTKPTPRESRAAARDERSQNLQIPEPLGRAALAEIRSRTPSPAAPGNAIQFNFPPVIPQPQQDQFEDVNMGDANETVQALTDALQGVRVSSRKPELPAFDSKNVDIWLKRVDNAYRRSGVVDPKDKFAFIETKFAVDADPKINEFLYGDGTADDWTAFEKYLRDRYGRTKIQQTAVILDGFQREGKLPSEMFAAIKEKIGNITIDDLVKEMVLRELPTDIRRTIHDKVKDADGAETVKLADQYFDRNGKPIHRAPSSQVNAVNDVPDLVDTDGEDDVNAVNRRFQRNRRGRPQQGRSQQGSQQGQKPQFTKPQQSRPPNASFTPAFTEKRTHKGKPTVKSANLCKWHAQFGKDAYTCEPGCDKFAGFQKPGKAQAGRQT